MHDFSNPCWNECYLNITLLYCLHKNADLFPCIFDQFLQTLFLPLSVLALSLLVLAMSSCEMSLYLNLNVVIWWLLYGSTYSTDWQLVTGLKAVNEQWILYRWRTVGNTHLEILKNIKRPRYFDLRRQWSICVQGVADCTLFSCIYIPTNIKQYYYLYHWFDSQTYFIIKLNNGKLSSCK